MVTRGVAINLIDKLIQADRESPKRILVIGDVMTDIYVHGRLEDCQDGCQKFVQESCVVVPGGAANAWVSLKHWNAQIGCPNIMAIDTAPIKRRFMVGNKCVFRHDLDEYRFDLRVVRNETMRMLKECNPNAVLISDYDKGLLTPEFIRDVIVFCNSCNIPCVADAKREPKIYYRATIKANAEYAMKYKPSLQYRMVITQGSKPPIIPFTQVECQTKPVECVNHVGAGDCFAAHLTLALVHGFSIKDAAAIAHSAGRVYVQHPHNRAPYPSEIKADMDN